MKTIKTTLIALALFALSLNLNAATAANPLKNLSSTKVISSYVETITLGNADFSKHLFTNDFEYHNVTNDKKYGKKEYVKFLNQNKGLKFDCETSYEVFNQTDDTCTAKVTMKFEHFTRIDYITLHHNQSNWQVGKVVTTYP